MSGGEKNDPPRKRSLFRRAITPPPIRGISRPNAITEEYQNFRKQTGTIRHRCPRDGSKMEMADLPKGIEYLEERDNLPKGDDLKVVAARALYCPQCGLVVPVQRYIEEAKGRLPVWRSQERQGLILAVLAVFFCVFAAIWQQRLLNLFAGFLLCIIFILLTMMFRYRIWQAEHERMFENRPPLLDWLRYEMAGKKARREAQPEIESADSE